MISVVIPVCNEEDAILGTIDAVKNTLEGFVKYEIVVVNDGSTDLTSERIKQYNVENIKIINHVENLGYGKSLLDGIIIAQYECVAIIDADGSYPAERIRDLYCYYPEYDMIIGARQGKEYSRGTFKKPARIFFKCLVEYTCGRKIADVNSGLRIFKKSLVIKFQDSLCAGFSFTTTITLIFLLNHYYVKYIPIEYLKRKGKSKVNHLKDTLRTGQLITTAILYHNPIKLFLLFAFCNLIIGVVIESINFFFFKAAFFTIVSALCVAGFIPIWSIGFIAEQLRRVYNLNKEKK